MKKQNKGFTPIKSGFTLMELLIVISIIAILSVLAIFMVVNQIYKANDARRKAELKRIGTALEEYEKDSNCYPTEAIVTCSGGGTGLRPYLDSIPCDPVTNAPYLYERENSSCPKWYRLRASLQNKNDPDFSSGFISASPNAPDPENPQTDFYGCFSGVCTQISWNPARPGPACDPNFQSSNCYNQCSNPSNECQTWNQ